MNDTNGVDEAREYECDGRFQAMSYRFRVRSDLDGADAVIPRLFENFRAPNGDVDADATTYTLTADGSEAASDRDDVQFELLKDGRRVNRVANPGSLLDWMIGDIGRRAFDNADYVAVHAGVVSRAGRAVVMPAPPDSGKTTLTAGLTRGGFSFLSDEVAAIDPATALVHPFPRPLMIDPEAMEVLDGLRERLPEAYEAFRLRRHHVAPDDLRAGAMGGPCPVATIVVPAYRPGAETRLHAMGRAETLFHLAESCLNLEAVGRRGFLVLARLARDLPSYRLAIGDLGEAVDVVRGLVASGRA